MKFKSEAMTQASGSIGGTTYGHNRGGLYRRARSIPVNPSSPAQLAARNAFSTLAIAWRETLTQGNRDAWETYAQLTPVTDSLGDPLILSGQQMYIRNNTARLRATIARVDAGPIGGGGTPLTTPTLAVQNGGADIDVSYTNTDPWAIAVGGALIVQVSRQMQPTINFFKGPFRFAGAELGAVIPPTSPLIVANGFGDIYAIGQKVYARCVAVSPEGRISGAQVITAIVA